MQCIATSGANWTLSRVQPPRLHIPPPTRLISHTATHVALQCFVGLSKVNDVRPQHAACNSTVSNC